MISGGREQRLAEMNLTRAKVAGNQHTILMRTLVRPPNGDDKHAADCPGCAIEWLLALQERDEALADTNRRYYRKWAREQKRAEKLAEALRNGAERGETEAIRAWCRLALNAGEDTGRSPGDVPHHRTTQRETCKPPSGEDALSDRERGH